MLRHASQPFALAHRAWTAALGRLADSVSSVGLGFASSTSTTAEQPERGQVWVGNLPYKVNPLDVRKEFEAYGGGYVHMLRDKETKRLRGMAFVTVDPDKVDKAVAEVNGRDFQGRTLRVAKRTAPDGRSGTSTAAAPAGQAQAEPAKPAAAAVPEQPAAAPKAQPAPAQAAAAPAEQPAQPQQPVAAKEQPALAQPAAPAAPAQPAAPAAPAQPAPAAAPVQRAPAAAPVQPAPAAAPAQPAAPAAPAKEQPAQPAAAAAPASPQQK